MAERTLTEPRSVAWLLAHPIQTCYVKRDGQWVVSGYRRKLGATDAR